MMDNCCGKVVCEYLTEEGFSQSFENLRLRKQEKPKKWPGFSFSREEGLHHPSTVAAVLSVADVELGVVLPWQLKWSSGPPKGEFWMEAGASARYMVHSSTPPLPPPHRKEWDRLQRDIIQKSNHGQALPGSQSHLYEIRLVGKMNVWDLSCSTSVL